ncbi:hypothetical protein SABIM44S_05382 [Streptomyces abikoensis]
MVDMHPSESTRSNVVRVAARRAASSPAVSMSASVVRTTSIVASPGASIPAPLAIPPTIQPSSLWTTAVLWTVSVVLIAMAALSPPCTDSAAAAFSIPGSNRSIGSRTPISPVEATATSPALWPRTSAAFSAVACVSWKPSGPVHAFAPPEFSTTAET